MTAEDLARAIELNIQYIDYLDAVLEKIDREGLPNEQ